MVYQQFLETTREQLQQMLGPNHRLAIYPVPKNNGIVLDGLSDQSDESPLAPMVYLNSYYDQYMLGNLSIKEICRDIKKIFTDTPLPDGIHTEALNNYKKMRPRVMMKLIHADANRELLKDIPNIPYLDLAIVFYLCLKHSEDRQMTVLIHNDHLRKWDTDTQDLLKQASYNTPETYPAQIYSMSDILKKIAQNNLGDTYSETVLEQLLTQEDAAPLFVLTNPPGINGAVCILYSNVLKDFSSYLQKDLVILPSSIHEVLLTPYDPKADYQEFNTMVQAVNQQEVSTEDRLSDHIYLYQRDSDTISIPGKPFVSQTVPPMTQGASL